MIDENFNQSFNYNNMRLPLQFKTLCLQIALLLFLSFSAASVHAQCIENIKLNTVEVANNAPQCSYTAEVCVDVMTNPVPDHVNIEITSSAGVFSQQVQSFGYINNKACYTFFLSNVACGEMVQYNAYGYETPSFTSVCSKVGNSRNLSAALAVEFAYFNGTQSRGDIVLEWVTMSEEDSDYFEVQISKDGTNYSALEKVAAAGNSQAENAYQYTHENPLAGTNYYRLKQVDFDGSYEYSEVFAIRIESTNEVNIFPTAVDDYVNVRIVEEVAGDIPVLVFNATGNLVYQNIIPAGAKELVVPTIELESGYYFIKMELDEIGVVTKPFIRKTL